MHRHGYKVENFTAERDQREPSVIKGGPIHSFKYGVY